MKSVPDEICKLVNLTKLSLSNNFLTELPRNFHKLKKLSSLDIANNNLDHFPDSLCELRELEFLDLSDNSLVLLPPGIGQLKELRTLLLFLNKLDELPDDICHLVELNMLWIGENNIQSLPVEFGNLKKLDWGKGFTPSSSFDGNPLVYPPIEVVKEGVESIAKYFKEHPEGPSREPSPQEIVIPDLPDFSSRLQ